MLFFIAYALLVVCDIYAYQALRTLGAPAWLRVAYWCVVVLGMFAPMFGIWLMGRGDGVRGAAMNVFILVALPIAFVATALIIEDVGRLIALAVRRFADVKPLFVPRARWASITALILGGVALLSVLYGITFGKYSYRVCRQTVYSSDLPDGFNGFRIVLLSDFHAGSLTSREDVQRGIDLAVAQHPDLFIFSGDAVNNAASELEPWAEMLSQIKAPCGQYAVLGNHDYGDYMRWSTPDEKAQNLQQLIITEETIGWHVLLDENVNIARGGDTISLIGVQNIGMSMHFRPYGNLRKAMQGVDSTRFKVLVSHDPSHWDKEVCTWSPLIQLTLSGHTHGFQMGIETPWFQFSPVQWVYPHWGGLYQSNGRQLYVNRGFGYIPFFLGRIGIRPEITVITLRKAASS